MQIIAVTNIKGGVGKTTAAVNLAYLAAAAGSATLLWDLDPQGAATWMLRGVPNANASAKKLVLGKQEPSELIATTAYKCLHLLPSDLSFRKFDLRLNERNRPTEQLLRMSRVLRDRYAYLFLDCPPGISLLSENVLRAADAVVVPLLPSPLSVRMLTQLQEFVAREGWTDLKLLPVFSMVDRRKSLHVEVVATTRARFPITLAAEIPYWSEIERMSVRRQPLPAYAPRSAAARIYQDLWSEVLIRLGATVPGATDFAVSVPASSANPEPALVAAHDPTAGSSESRLDTTSQ